jgi:hypothetical protein
MTAVGEAQETLPEDLLKRLVRALTQLAHSIAPAGA